ncbi:MAG: UDP-N-acetylmuramoyl-tripeptide--D-alanyl-D-alanine ligase [Clostridiales Family XIII bacterium]|nr:UDP-N-acetylmuramoyl-tripeptide--D-alanyl-D-alanine ligase [Clostridiales Family XIII bacterium]
MKALSIGETAKAVGGRLLAGRDGDTYCGVSSDSRTVARGNLFFALRGKRFDAHDFLSQVARRGCGAIVVSKPDAAPEDFGGAVIGVPDTLIAYQALAAYYRRLIDPTTVGVTGSVGKTSLKDMIAFVCGALRRTVWTDKNYNNHIGVPRTIFEMDEDTEVLILEMGMSRQGEIERLAEIARPDVAVISNVGVSHRENFDGDDGIFRAKAEITTFLDEDGVLVVNGDDPLLRALADAPTGPYRCVTAGTDLRCDFRVTEVKYAGESGIAFQMTHGGETVRFALPAAGLHNGLNAALAVAVLHELGVGMDRAAELLRSMTRTPHRLQLLERDGIKIIDDSYNAGPASMRSALEYLTAVAGRRRIAVLAGMNELGDRSPSLHAEVGRFAAATGVNLLITVGEKARDIYLGAREACACPGETLHFADNAAVIDFLAEWAKPGDVYLVKGSRAMRMEEIVGALAEARASVCSRGLCGEGGKERERNVRAPDGADVVCPVRGKRGGRG